MRICIFILIFSNIFSQKTKKQELLIPYRDGNLWGLCDTLGIVKVKPFADEVFDYKFHYFEKPYTCIVLRSKKGYSFFENQVRLDFPSSEIDSIKVSYFDIYTFKNGKTGFYSNYKKLINPLYDNIQPSLNQSFIVSNSQKFGVINKSGKLIIPVVYDEIYPDYDYEYGENTFNWRVYKSGKKTILHDLDIYRKKAGVPVVAKTGRESTSSSETKFQIENIKSSEDFKILEKELNKKYGYIDTYYLDQFKILIAEKDDKNALLDEKGNVIIPLEKQKISFFARDKKEALIKIEKEGNVGLVTRFGVIKAPLIYDNIYHDKQKGVYVLEKNGKKGMIILDSIYERVEPKYLDIRKIKPLIISDKWIFNLYEVTTIEEKKGWIGENGIEFFKN